MKIIVLGAGQAGYNISRYLAQESEDDITIVDQSEELLQRVADQMDIQPVVGFASDPDVLDQAGAAEADIIIAVTASDEVNIVACEVANSLFKVKTKIARIRNQHYLNPDWAELFSPNHLAVDVTISPEIEVAKAITRSIEVAGAFDVFSLLSAQVKIVGVRPKRKSPLLNTPLKMLPGLFPDLEVTIGCIIRDEKVIIPSGEDRILDGDEVYCLVHADKTLPIMEAFGFENTIDRRVLIMGGGLIGLNLARQIEENLPGVTTKVIEQDPSRAETIARQLKRTEVLCGDALDHEVINEANVAATESVVTVTHDDKVNILSSLLAKRHGASRAMTLLNNTSYASLVTSLGVDAVVDPRSITVSSILQHTREGRARSIYSLHEGEVEIMEAEAKETSSIIGLSIEDIIVEGEIHIPVLRRGDTTLFSPSKTVVHSGDRLIVFVLKGALKKIEKLFSTRPTYL